MSKSHPANSLYLAAPDLPCEALAWFEAQNITFKQHLFDWGIVLHFDGMGDLALSTDNLVVGEQSPVVTIRTPKIKRKILWTVGEVRFCFSPLARYPELQKLRRAFIRWFNQYPVVFDDHPSATNEFNYYLEGAAQNRGPITAFPSGLTAIKAGRYFVFHSETDDRLETLRKTLALRGVVCGDID